MKLKDYCQNNPNKLPQIDNLRTTDSRQFTIPGFNRQPATLDREQLEYSAKQLLTFGIIGFAVLGVAASVTYMTIQQLRK
ncbi:MAG: hypothetical protein NY202_04880 [Mollicutes bacterium UO1]